MNCPRLGAGVALAIAALASVSSAQELLRHDAGVTGPVVLSDLTGDNVRDYVTLEFTSPQQFVFELRSGATGAIVSSIVTNQVWNGSELPKMWPLPDVDHDGVGEVGLQNGTTVKAYSVVTGALVRTYSIPGMQLAYSMVAALDDVDGDGVDDLAVGVPHVGMHCAGQPFCIWLAADAGTVEILSGASGAVVRSIVEPPPAIGLVGTMFGARVIDFGDFDGDGIDDLLVSNYYGVHGPTPIYVDAYSSATGVLLFHMPFPTSGFPFGYDGALAAPGDVDGDGVPDFAVGEPTKARVRMFSGATRAQLFTSWGGPYSTSGFPSYGATLCVVGDQNNDGVRDLAINAPQPNAPYSEFMPEPASATGYATIVSSTDGRELWTRVGHGQWEWFTVTGSLADFDGDGKAEIFAQSYDWAVPPNAWGVGLYSSRLGYSTPTSYCTSSTHLSAVGSTSLSANNFVLAVQGGEPNTTGYFLSGARATGGGTGNLPCVLGPGLRLTPWFSLDASGNGMRAVQLANSALFLSGTTWNFQFTYASTTPLGVMRFSDALSVTFTL
jgi:hypothetical protein